MSHLPLHLWRNRIHYLLLALILFGFWLRLSFLLSNVYHIDEFISMLAVQMVALKGWPILPSGLFYDHGLLFSLLSGALVKLVGFREAIARWPSLLFSVMTIPAYYFATRRLFNSPTAGLFAAMIFTLDDLSIVWGGRVRMYAQAHFFVLLTLFWLISSTLQRPSLHSRYVCLAMLVGALLSHTISFLIGLPLAILLFIFTLTYRRAWLFQARLWQQVVVGGFSLFLILTIVATGQTSSTNAVSATAMPAQANATESFISPDFTWRRFDDLIGYYQADPYGWLLFVIIMALPWSLFHLYRSPQSFADNPQRIADSNTSAKAHFAAVAFLFLTLYCLLVILEQGGLLGPTWQKTRYLFVLVTPAFFMLGAASLNILLEIALRLITYVPPLRPFQPQTLAMIPFIGLLGISQIYGATAWKTAHAVSAGSYNTAFEFVADQRQADDKIMTVHPSAAYIYTGQSDYYANQTSARVLEADEDTTDLVDRYIGSPLINSVDQFNQVLSQPMRVWLVVDKERLFSRFEPFWVQQIFAQMELARDFGGVYVFRSRPAPRPILAEPQTTLSADFNQIIKLGGYSLLPSGDGTIKLVLYWQPQNLPPIPLKVFVQLRNGTGQNLAQADHFILDNLLSADAWQDLQRTHDWLRDTAHLTLPSMPTEAVPYRLYIGLYHPDTFERVPLLMDSSGENAVIIGIKN